MTTNEIVDYGVVLEGDGGWYWRAMSLNGRKVAIGGEPFATRFNAVSALCDLFPALSHTRVFDDGSDALSEFLSKAMGHA